jgi:hypothetical protein
VRNVGGRFLDLDERTGIYEDIGDKKATEKTSQALREGQTKIRKKIYTDEVATAAAAASPPANIQQVISLEGYFGFSVQVLESLYKADENESVLYDENGNKNAISAAAASLDPSNIAYGNSTPLAKVHEQLQGHGNTYHEQHPSKKQPHHQQMSAPMPATSSSTYLNSIAVARALEQFPGAGPPAQQAIPTRLEGRLMCPTPRQRNFTSTEMPLGQSRLDPSHTNIASSIGICDAGLDDRGGGGRYRPSSSSFGDGRLTNMSIASMFSINSIRQLLESSSSDPRGGEDRHRPSSNDRETIESALSAEIRDLIRRAVPPRDDLVGGNLAMDDMDVLVDRDEMDRFDKDAMMDYDRVSDLRFTDMSTRWSSDSTESTTNRSKNSSMDASSTRSSENMSIHTSTSSCKKRRSMNSTVQPRPVSGMEDSGDIASAELLLQLSR